MHGELMDPTEILINEVKKHPCLYEPAHKDFKNNFQRGETWKLIAEMLGQDCETAKNRWKNLKDSYMKYKKCQSTDSRYLSKMYRKYKNWPWRRQMDFLDGASSSIEAETLKNDTAESSDDFYFPPMTISPLTFEAQAEPISTPKKKKKSNETSSIDKVINYLEKSESFDAVDHLFLSYAHTFKTFSVVRQASLKVELANMFAKAEVDEFHEKEISEK
ncbi:unnamed protein product [Acanthoscelides obtectus]|uniref:MADF domain-containing protein n=1 Tax=Acanthoscelides obtectus TaxID=200917 RepID=A0A9P0LFH0_ACAOB|nr:unnamed protein product [Acanthoscelides obtectus]CAK1662797.1 Transcription factor Adf-1 [Acanthoscelides obtectus]